MIPSRFIHYWQNNKQDLLQTALLSLMSAGFLAAAAALTAQVINGVLLAELNFPETAPKVLVLFLCLCGWQLSCYAQNHWQDKLAAQTIARVRRQLHRASFTKAAAPHNTTLLQLSCEAAAVLADDFRIILPLILGLTIHLPFYLLLLAITDYLSALICLITLPVAPILLYLLSSIIQKRSLQAWEKLQSLTQGFYELLQTLPLLKLFAQEQKQEETARQLITSFSSAALQSLKIAFMSTFVLELITTLAIALVAVVIGLRLLDNDIHFVTAFFILLLLPEIYRPLRQSGTVFHTLMNVNTAAHKIDNYLSPTSIAPGTGHQENLQIPPEIHLTQLAFTYPHRHHPVIDNLSLTFPANSITLLTGCSGSGKSTLLSLLACLLPPDSGAIFLNGQNLLTMHPASQQKLIAYMPQEPHLYQANLRDNLLLFQTAPDERCRQALRLSMLTEWFQTLPQGLNTLLGEGGQPLSQGQLKRLGLARVILQNCPIILLDEPTSGLDAHLETQILRTISVLSKQRTVIISSHHAALLKLADNIVNLNAYMPKEE